MVDYDRELIACMLERCEHTDYTRAELVEQARLLREADNADAAGVHTATQPPAVGVDVTDEMVERACAVWWGSDWGTWTGWQAECKRAKARRILTAALRTGGGE